MASNDHVTPSFTCPDCGATSYNPNDLRYRYCGRCHRSVDGRVQVRCILVFGSGPDARAELETPWHPTRAPLAMRAGDVAAQANLPVGELPGRRFWAEWDGQVLTGFALVNDPRI